MMNDLFRACMHPKSMHDAGGKKQNDDDTRILDDFVCSASDDDGCWRGAPHNFRFSGYHTISKSISVTCHLRK